MKRLKRRWFVFSAILLLITPLKADEVGKIVILGEWNFQGSFFQCRDLTSNGSSRLSFYWRSGGAAGSRQGDRFDEFAKLIRALDEFKNWDALKENSISIPWDQDFLADFSARGVTLNFGDPPKHPIRMSWEDARSVATAIEKGWARIQAER